MFVLAIIVSFLLGFFAGSYTRRIIYDAQDWMILKWEKNSLGYRPMSYGQIMHKNQNLVMALRLNTEDFPNNGIRYEQR